MKEMTEEKASKIINHIEEGYDDSYSKEEAARAASFFAWQSSTRFSKIQLVKTEIIKDLAMLASKYAEKEPESDESENSDDNSNNNTNNPGNNLPNNMLENLKNRVEQLEIQIEEFNTIITIVVIGTFVSAIITLVSVCAN